MGNVTGGLSGMAIGAIVGGPIGAAIGLTVGGITGMTAEAVVGSQGQNKLKGEYFFDPILYHFLDWQIGANVEVHSVQFAPVGAAPVLSLMFAPMSTYHNGGPGDFYHHYAILKLIKPDDPSTFKWVTVERLGKSGSTGIHIEFFRDKHSLLLAKGRSTELFGKNGMRLCNIKNANSKTVQTLINVCKRLSPNYNLLSQNCQHFCVELLEQLQQRNM